MTDCKRPAYVEVTPTVGVAFIATLNKMTSIKNCKCSILTKESEVEEIRHYFNAILELSKSDNEFPINLDEVWMLVYSEKSKAVRALTENFIESVDYKVLAQNGKNPHGGRPVNEYRLSISCLEFFIARKVRPVFEVYRQVFHKAATGGFPVPRSLSEALMLAASQAKQIEEQQLKIKADAPKVLFADAVTTSQRSCLVAELAKILQQNGVDIGQNRLFTWLRDNGYLCLRGQYYNQPTQKAMELGLFEIKQTSITKPDGTVLVTSTTKVTGKGQVYFINKFLSKGN